MKKQTINEARMEKERKKGLILAAVIILSILTFMAGIFSYFNYFAYDKPLEADTFTMAWEKDGKLYKLDGFQESSFAFDDELYSLSPAYLADLTAFSYGDYEITQTGNPFFAGNIRGKNRGKYLDQQTKYANPKESYQSYTIYDQNRNQIFAHEYGMKGEYVAHLRPNYPWGDARKRFFDKREYLNLTRLLKDKLNVNLKLKADEANKLLILSFQK